MRELVPPSFGMTIAQACATRENNFDYLRVTAAFMVIGCHCYPLTGRTNEFFYRLLGYDSGGGWGLAIFFTISGFLVTRSCLAHDPLRYLLSRALRILPLLMLVRVLELFVLGPIFTTETLSEYFPHAQSHLLNAFVFGMVDTLPGVFRTHPITGVNGSLFSLPIETSFYILLPILRVVGILRKKTLLIVTVLLGLVYLLGVTRYGWAWSNQGGYLFAQVSFYSGVKNGIFFLSGALLFLYRKEIPLNIGLAVCCLMLLGISRRTAAEQFVYFLTFPYLIIYLALARPVRLPFFKKLGDVSYGVYVFAWPVQQSIIAVQGAGIQPWVLVAITTPIVLCLAAASWRYVEYPALQFRDRLLNRRAGATDLVMTEVEECPAQPWPQMVEDQVKIN